MHTGKTLLRRSWWSSCRVKRFHRLVARYEGADDPEARQYPCGRVLTLSRRQGIDTPSGSSVLHRPFDWLFVCGNRSNGL